MLERCKETSQDPCDKDRQKEDKTDPKGKFYFHQEIQQLHTVERRDIKKAADPADLVFAFPGHIME